MNKKNVFGAIAFMILYFILYFISNPDTTLGFNIVNALFGAIIFLIAQRFIEKKRQTKLLAKDTHKGDEIICQGLMNHLRGIIAAVWGIFKKPVEIKDHQVGK